LSHRPSSRRGIWEGSEPRGRPVAGSHSSKVGSPSRCRPLAKVCGRTRGRRRPRPVRSRSRRQRSIGWARGRAGLSSRRNHAHDQPPHARRSAPLLATCATRRTRRRPDRCPGARLSERSLAAGLGDHRLPHHRHMAIGARRFGPIQLANLPNERDSLPAALGRPRQDSPHSPQRSLVCPCPILRCPPMGVPQGSDPDDPRQLQ
jgi:hypothetical protein